MKYKITAILTWGTVISVMLSSCRYLEEILEDFSRIEIYNATGDTICFYQATGFYVDGPTAYPDTFLPPDKVYWKGRTLSEAVFENPIFPYSINYTHSLIDKKNRALPIDTFSIFFINRDTLRKYGYDMVRDSNLILDRYDLPMEEIRKLYKTGEQLVFPRNVQGINEKP